MTIEGWAEWRDWRSRKAERLFAKTREEGNLQDQKLAVSRRREGIRSQSCQEERREPGAVKI
ncbi:hypothetical protein N7488_011186 [Penicillium malachiteum]|nr:hypothetical protein N7488_011186 [Penicillium malachiteum]